MLWIFLLSSLRILSHPLSRDLEDRQAQRGLPHVGDPYVMLIQRWSGRQLGS